MFLTLRSCTIFIALATLATCFCYLSSCFIIVPIVDWIMLNLLDYSFYSNFHFHFNFNLNWMWRRKYNTISDREIEAMIGGCTWRRKIDKTIILTNQAITQKSTFENRLSCKYLSKTLKRTKWEKEREKKRNEHKIDRNLLTDIYIYLLFSFICILLLLPLLPRLSNDPNIHPNVVCSHSASFFFTSNFKYDAYAMVQLCLYPFSSSFPSVCFLLAWFFSFFRFFFLFANNVRS